VSLDANVIVTFSELMDPATVNGSTVELLDLSSALVPATVSYDASSLRATLDPTGPLSAGTTYTARVNGGDTDPRVKDRAGNALAATVTWTFRTVGPPRVLSTTPTTAETDVLIGVAPRATFTKALSFLSLTDSILLQDAAGNLIPFNITVDPSLSTIAILPDGLLQPLQTYTVTLKGGPDEPHITDIDRTPLESDYTWSFTTAAAPPPIPTFSVFEPSVTPANPISSDPMAVELGMKFRSENDGFITGVRFYKGGAANGGRHVGHLWTSDGTPLGSVNFNTLTETESGWQQALFQTPIPITANTTYVVSYFAPQGNYAADLRHFASTGVDSPPLHALRDGVEGGNGVFLYSPTGGFPTDTFMSTNYYVDVVFSPTISPPQVLSTNPSAGGFIFFTGDEQPPVTFSVTFTEAIDPASVNTSTVLLTDTLNNPVPFTISFGSGNFTVTLTPPQPVSFFGAYTVTLKGGANEPHITDAAGTPLAADYTWSFITEALLRPASTEVTMLGNWDTAGGNFIFMRPDKKLASLLGLTIW
jgi:hypothetical protein